MKIDCIVVDDEPIAREIIRDFLKDHPEVNVLGECSNGNEAIKEIITLKPHLVFLDIQMPDLDGFEVLNALAHNLPHIIITTSYDKYALQAFEINAVDYLLKPFDQDRFDAAFLKATQHLKISKTEEFEGTIQKLMDFHRAQNESKNNFIDKFIVREAGNLIPIPIEDVEWVEAAGDYIKIHTRERSYMLNKTMNYVTQYLSPESFLKIHRSIIIRKDQIQRLEAYFNGEYFIVLKNKCKLKSSRTYKKEIQQYLKS